MKSSEKISLKTCLILIIAVSLTSSFLVGTALSLNFTSKLKKQTAFLEKKQVITDLERVNPAQNKGLSLKSVVAGEDATVNLKLTFSEYR